MQLPPLPKLPLPPLPLPPLPNVPTSSRYDQDADEGFATHVSVSKLKYDTAEVRIGDLRTTLTRSQVLRLIGQLERVARRL